MARHIYVYRPDEPNRGRWSYEAPLGGEGAVGDDWSRPAGELGLPLLASIYYEVGRREGIEWSGTRLDEVEAELPTPWSAAGPRGPWTRTDARTWPGG